MPARKELPHLHRTPCGASVRTNDTNAIYVTDDSPNAEPRYRARFYFDPNSITMASGDAHYIFKGFSGASTDLFQVEFRYSSGNYEIRARVLNDASSWTNSNWFVMSDASHYIEVDWRAAQSSMTAKNRFKSSSCTGRGKRWCSRT